MNLRGDLFRKFKMGESQKRRVAHKICIKDIVEGKYVTEEGWQPNYIVTKDGKQISRVNVIGIVVLKADGGNLNYKSIVLDDGTGKISIRSFDEKNQLPDPNIGDVVLLIGKPREYGQEKYLVPEIIKKIENKSWIDVRKFELKDRMNVNKNELEPKEDLSPDKEEGSQIENVVLEEEMVVENRKLSNSEKILNLVKELDAGMGADMQELVSKCSMEEGEKVIKTLLEQGEIFEIKPGRLKILE